MKYSKKRTFEITSKNKNFKDIVDKDDNFTITCKHMTTKDSIALADMFEATEKEGSNESYFNFMVKTFNTVVVGWEGLKTEDGEEIKFSEEEKQDLIENFFDFIVAVVSAYNEEKDKKK